MTPSYRGPAGVLFLLLLMSPILLPAQEGLTPSSVYPDDSDAAESMLRSASAFIRDRQWQEAADMYQKIIAQYGDRAVRIPDTVRVDARYQGQTRRWYNQRDYVIGQMASLPPEAREAFARAGEVQAGVLWNRAISPESGDKQRRADLVRLATEFYLSRYGYQAIERLGDMAFDEGEFKQAVAFYRQLVRLPDEPSPENGVLQLPAVHPGEANRQTIVTAKLILASHAAGSFTEARTRAVLQAFATKWPQAEGVFAGRSGLLAASLLKAITEDKIYRKPPEDANWPTFAGNFERNRLISDPIDIGARQWAVKIEPVLPPRTMIPTRGRFGGFGGFAGRGGFNNNPQLGRPANPILAYHPVIVGEMVIYCTENRLVAYNLNEAARPDGTVGPSWWQDIDKLGSTRGQNSFFISGSPRMTLSASGDRLYARLGESGNSMAFGNQFNSSNSIVAAFDLRNKGQVIWRVAGSKIPLKQPDGVMAPEFGSIEGSPVADADRVYLVLTLPGVQTSTYVVALSANTGNVEWTRYLFDIPNPFDMQAAAQGAVPGHAHHLLTMADGNLYYQSDSGGVASIEAGSGRLRWVTSYPKRDPNATSLSRRDLNPPVFDHGTLYTAPVDSQQIYALDAESGSLKWISAPLPDVVHLVGATQGNLFATGDRVWTIDAATGRILRSWPDSGTGYPASGRGLIAGNFLYWPTENDIHVIDAKNGLRSQKGSINLRDFQSQGGNLALGDGFLVIAGLDTLSVFTQNSRLIRRYQQIIADNPESAFARYRLATAAENLGEMNLAIEAYREALRRVRPADRIDGQPMERLIRDRFYHLLVRQAAQEKQPEVALKLLTEAASESSDPLRKLASRMTIAAIQMQRNEALGSFRELAAIARDPVANSRFWQTQGFYHVNLAAQARFRLEEAWLKLSPNDRSQIESEDLKQIQLRASSQEAGPMIDYLRGVPPGPAEAAGWLAIWPKLDSAQVADLVSRLEKQPGLSAGVTARIAASKRQLQAESAGMAGESAQPGLPRRIWASESDASEQVWLLSDINDQPASPTLYQKTALLRTTTDGRASVVSRRDESALASLGDDFRKPLWGGLVKGRGLVFDGQAIVGFDPVTGRRAWRLDLSEVSPGTSLNSPFAKPSDKQDEGSGSAGARRGTEFDWWMFQASGDRLIVQSIHGDCWRIDPVFGRLLWHRRTEPGDGATAILLGRHVLMRDGSSVLLLDADSGEMKRSIDGSIAGTQWIRRPIAWDEDRVLMTADRMQVIMLDLKKGQQAWRWQASEIQPTNGPPRYFRHGETLVGIADGKTLVRIDPTNGNRLWSTTLGSFDYSLEQRNVAVDDRHVYLIEPLEYSAGAGVKITAHTLTDGSPVWTRRVIGSAISWAVESVPSGSSRHLWVYPDCETSRRLATGQAMTAMPADLGENQGNSSSGISSVVAELDPADGQILRRLVSRVSDSANWVMPDWSGGQLLWASRSRSRHNLIQVEPVPGQSGSDLTPR